MWVKCAAVMSLLALAACGGNPWVEVDDGGNGGTTDPVVPDELAKNLNAISYSASDGGQLRVDLTGLISSGQYATFTRKASLDIPASGTSQNGYQAFVYQETGTQRAYLAYVATNARGTLIAAATADGGQFNTHNGGGTFAQISTFTRPTVSEGVETGLFSYAGSYAGVFVPGDWVDTNRPPGLRPAQPWTVSGEALINASFATNQVEGGVVNRALYDSDGNKINSITLNTTVIDTTELAPISLITSTIDENGQFLGDVELYGAPGSRIGDYGGLFGGIEASDVAGVLVFNPIKGQSGVWEYGTFNLPRCDLAGASPICLPR